MTLNRVQRAVVLGLAGLAVSCVLGWAVCLASVLTRGPRVVLLVAVANFLLAIASSNTALSFAYGRAWFSRRPHVEPILVSSAIFGVVVLSWVVAGVVSIALGASAQLQSEGNAARQAMALAIMSFVIVWPSAGGAIFKLLKRKQAPND